MELSIMLLQSIAAIEDPTADVTKNLAHEMLTLYMFS
jgi:hypothetical protein